MRTMLILVMVAGPMIGLGGPPIQRMVVRAMMPPVESVESEEWECILYVEDLDPLP
jgi:hypothetical protein